MERYCSKLLYKSAESVNVAGNKTIKAEQSSMHLGFNEDSVGLYFDSCEELLFREIAVADRHLDLKGRGVSFAYPVGLSSLCDFSLFYPPSPRSAIE